MKLLRMRIPKLLIIYLVVAWPIMMFCLFMLISGKMTMALSGFAVDSTGKLYLGKDSKIEVYENGELINTLSPMTSRGYIFTIQPDDTILLSTSTNVYVLDLQGNVVSENEDTGTKVFNSIQRKTGTFSSIDGNTYTLGYPWMRAEIVRSSDGTVIYRMPDDEYIIKLLTIAVFISIFISVPFCIRNWKKINNQ